MRTTAIATVLVLGMTAGYAGGQSVGIPKTFQPSLSAEVKRVHLKNPPLTTAPDVKTTLYRVGDALGMLRDIEERDAVLTMDWRGTGTITVGGQSCKLANYRGQVRYSVPAMRTDFACAQADGKPGPRMVQVVAGTLAWNETTPGVGGTPALDTVTDRLVQLWSLPHAVYKGALLAGANAKTTLEGGVLYLTYPLPAPLNGTARVALNTTDADDVTPLMAACSLGRAKGTRVALRLIEAGADVRLVRASDGMTALNFAVGGSAELIQALTDRGA